MSELRENLAERIRALSLPEAVVRIAVDGGETVSPALRFRAQSVWHDPAQAVMRQSSEELVPLWSCGTTHAFAGQNRYLIWNPESDEPDAVFDDFAGLVRNLLTDLYEDEEDDEERSRLAHLLLAEVDVAAVLVPEER